MKIIAISVRDKIAVNMSGVSYTCGNSDFVINFDFDAEWDEFSVKTARFIKDDRTYQDQVFQGNECPVPILYNTNKIRVGVFAGNLHTSTPAIISANKSILCGNGSPEAPSEDVYAQIMEMLNNSGGKPTDEQVTAAVNAYMKENPVGGGLSARAKSLLMTVLRNAVYTSDQVSVLSDLEVALAESGGSSGGGSGGGVVTCVITHALTNVTLSSEMGTILESGSEYIATLTPDTAHDLANVTVTMGGVDVTSAVYADGVVNIPIVSGNVVITAVAEIPASLMHYWDFTQSLDDLAGDADATIPNVNVSQTQYAQNFAYRDNIGVHIESKQDFVRFPGVFGFNRTYEFDVGEVAAQYGTSAHGRLFTVMPSGDTKWEGHGLLIYRCNTIVGWQAYSGTNATTTGSWHGSVIAGAVDAFANKTVKITVDKDGFAKYYIDNELIFTATRAFEWGADVVDITLGSYSASAYKTIIKGMRIYEGVR